MPRRLVLSVEWHHRGRRVVRFSMDRRGRVAWRWLSDPERLTPADREQAAALLGDFLPKLSHDERYALLFG